jgi:hypothetical protein
MGEKSPADQLAAIHATSDIGDILQSNTCLTVLSHQVKLEHVHHPNSMGSLNNSNDDANVDHLISEIGLKHPFIATMNDDFELLSSIDSDEESLESYVGEIVAASQSYFNFDMSSSEDSDVD